MVTLTEITSKPRLGRRFLRDDLRRLTVASTADVTTWTYDNTYQLTNENRASGPGFGWADMSVDQWANMSVDQWANLPVAGNSTSFNVTYTYDPAGNRKTQNDGTTITTLTYSPANKLQLASANGAVTTYTNDAVGNRTAQITPTETIYYSWDAAGNMATAEPAAGTVTLTYNADQQRAAKQSTDGAVTGFLYDYKRLLCETDAVGGAISQTYASDTTEEFGDLIGEDGQYIHQYDAQTNTNALLDDTGTVQAQYKYFAFGQVSAVSIDGGPWTAEDWSRRAGIPLDFTSNMLAGGKKQYYLDQEIALYLLGCGNNGRYYDAATGRFLSEDPTGEAGGDDNLFRYTGNDPVNNLDPGGHDSKKDPPKRDFHPPQNQQTQQHNQPHGAQASQQHTTPNQTPAGKPSSAGAPQDAAAAEEKRRTVMNFGQAAQQDQARIAALRANWQHDYNARLGLIHSNLSDAQLYSLMQHDIAQINTLQHGLTALHSEFDKAGLNQVTLPSVTVPQGDVLTVVRGGSGFENAARMAGDIGAAWAAEESGNLGGLQPTYDEVAFAVGGPVDDLAKTVAGKIGETIAPVVKGVVGKIAKAVGEKISGIIGKVSDALGKLFGKTAEKSASKGTTVPRSLGERIADFQKNPRNWERVSVSAERATRKSAKGGVSIESVYKNKVTGETIHVHDVYKPSGNQIPNHPTYRDYGKGGD